MPTADIGENHKTLAAWIVISVFLLGGCAAIGKTQRVEHLSVSDEVLVLPV